MRLLNLFLDIIAQSIFVRKVFRYSVNRLDGLSYGSYSLEEEVLLAASLLKEATLGWVIDAGANEGEWSSTLCTHILRFDKLLLIEPQRIYSDRLANKFGKNDRVIIERIAIGARTGRANLYSDRQGSGLASLYDRNLAHVGLKMIEQEFVEVTSLDSLAEKHGIKQISFLKLDLEGYEFEALKGAERLLRENRIRALVFEFGGCNVDSRTYFRDFWSLLVDRYGFELYRLLPNRVLKRLARYSETLEQFSWQNILACQPSTRLHWKIRE